MKAHIDSFRQELSGKSRDDIIDIAVTLFGKNIQINNKLNEFSRSSSEMALQYQQMQNELEGAKKEIKTLRKQNLHLTGVIALRNRSLFGRGTEKASGLLDHGMEENPDTDPLSEDAGGNGAGQDGRQEGSGKDSPEYTTGTGNIHSKRMAGTAGKRRKKEKGKRDEDLRNLPQRVCFDYDLEHRLARIPFVPVFPKSLASSSLLSSIIVDKYNLFLPLYRQEHDQERFGFPLSRKTMSNWISYACNGLLEPVYLYLCSLLREATYQQCDETTYTVIHDGRKAGTKSFVWTHRTSELAEGPEIIIYCYEKTRHTDHLRQFYAGLDHELFLTCDAYSAYPCFAGETGGLVKICGCFMHARRRFADALTLLDIRGFTEEQIHQLPEMKGIDLIAAIYAADEAMKGEPAEERLINRRLNVTPKVDAYFEFIDSFDLDDPLVSEKLKDAVQYSKNHKEALTRFLEDGNIPLDDGATERDIKMIAQGRRNYLFSNTIRGAFATVIASTLIVTAKANGANPYYYIKYLLEEMARHIYYNDTRYMPDLMPWSDSYTSYEKEQKQLVLSRLAPPGNGKPGTPRKGSSKKAG